MKNKKATKRSFRQKVRFSKDEVWSYQFDRKKLMAYIRNPEGSKTYPVGITDLGWDIFAVDRALMKGRINVKPREIKNYIKNNLVA